MDILFIAEAILYSDVSYRLRVMKLMREATRAARVSLFVFGVAPLENRSELDREIAEMGVIPQRSFCLPALGPLRPLELMITTLFSWFYLGFRFRMQRGAHLVQLENLMASLSALPFFFLPHHPPFILDYHGTVPEEIRLKRHRFSRFLYPLLKRLERRCTSRATGLIVPSERFRDYAMTSFGLAAEEIFVLPNRIDRVRFNPSPDGRRTARRELGVEDRFVVLYAGNAAPYQEAGLMVDGFREIFREYPRAFFLCLTGSTEEFSMLFRNAGLPGDCFRVLYVDHALVPDYLQAGDLALLLRRESIVNRVSSPTKFAEYLACGVPVMTTPWAGDGADWVERHRLGAVIEELSCGAVKRSALEFIERLRDEGEAVRDRCRRIAAETSRSEKKGGSLSNFYRGTSDRWNADG